ncbi:MAG: HpcH/HpaI aldolase family protein [Sphaerochaetaceae bacterium]
MKEGHLSCIGGHVFLSDPVISNAMAMYGYDFLWIDAEHGPFDKHNLMQHIIAANEGGAAALVRVASSDPAVIKPVLEMGIDGIIIPQILSAEEARCAIQACLYPPEGIRGYGPRRANRYGIIPDSEYLSSSRRSFLRILQIEHINAVEHIDEIAEVDGVDVLIIGPNDLSSSAGLLGHSTDEKILGLARRVIASGSKHSIPVGVSIGPDPSVMKIWAELGVDFISTGDDISFLRNGALSTISAIGKLKQRLTDSVSRC